VNTFTVRAVESAEKHRHQEAAKIGRDKTMPPKSALATRAGGRLFPRKIAPQPSQAIDVYFDREYQGSNSLPGVGSLLGGGGGSFQRSTALPFSHVRIISLPYNPVLSFVPSTHFENFGEEFFRLIQEPTGA